MEFMVVLTGNFTHDDVDSLRNEISGCRVKLSSGISAERIVSIFGSVTKENAEAIRKVFLRLLGEKKTFSIKMSRDNLELIDLPADNLGSSKEFVLEVLDRFSSLK